MENCARSIKGGLVIKGGWKIRKIMQLKVDFKGPKVEIPNIQVICFSFSNMLIKNIFHDRF